MCQGRVSLKGADMSISENIRSLAREGLSVAEIARRLGIRYQHAYNVLQASGMLPNSDSGARTGTATVVRGDSPSKPPLLVEELVRSGFEYSARWILSEAGELVVDHPLPKSVGVYAFAKGGIALYVGVATIGLAKRLRLYAKPGPTQRTSQRLNSILKTELAAAPAPFIDILTASPPDLEWNGLPIHGSAGLELGLIKKFKLPWNIRSANTINR
jgi:hypothetical protein